MIATIDWFVAWNQGHLALAGVSAAVVIVIGTVDLLPWTPPVRRVFTAMSQSTRVRTARGAATTTLTVKERLPGLVIATPLVVLVSLIAAAFVWVGQSIAALGVGVGVWWLPTRVSGAAISIAWHTRAWTRRLRSTTRRRLRRSIEPSVFLLDAGCD